MISNNENSPCRRHRWQGWENRDAYDDRVKGMVRIRLRKCKNCPAIETQD